MREHDASAPLGSSGGEIQGSEVVILYLGIYEFAYAPDSLEEGVDRFTHNGFADLRELLSYLCELLVVDEDGGL